MQRLFEMRLCFLVIGRLVTVHHEKAYLGAVISRLQVQGGSDAQYGKVAGTLIFLASAHGYLEMFDEARSALKQVLDLTRRCDGEESTRVAACHQQMACI